MNYVAGYYFKYINQILILVLTQIIVINPIAKKGHLYFVNKERKNLNWGDYSSK